VFNILFFLLEYTILLSSTAHLLHAAGLTSAIWFSLRVMDSGISPSGCLLPSPWQSMTVILTMPEHSGLIDLSFLSVIVRSWASREDYIKRLLPPNFSSFSPSSSSPIYSIFCPFPPIFHINYSHSYILLPLHLSSDTIPSSHTSYYILLHRSHYTIPLPPRRYTSHLKRHLSSVKNHLSST
jgi:hypothetical protein